MCQDGGRRRRRREKEDLKRGEAAVGRGRDGGVKTKEVVNVDLICVYVVHQHMKQILE